MNLQRPCVKIGLLCTPIAVEPRHIIYVHMSYMCIRVTYVCMCHIFVFHDYFLKKNTTNVYIYKEILSILILLIFNIDFIDFNYIFVCFSNEIPNKFELRTICVL